MEKSTKIGRLKISNPQSVKKGAAPQKLNYDTASVTITAAVYISSCSCSAAGDSGGSVDHVIRIIDNDGPSLTLTSQLSVIPEGNDDGARLIISRNTDTSVPITVTVTSDADDMLDYNHTVIIPAGEQQVDIIVKAKANSTTGDSRTVTFTAEAEGYSKSTFWMMISDSSLPDAVVPSIAMASTELSAGSSTDVSVTISNSGAVELPAQTCVTLYMLNDIVSKYYTQEPLAPGESVTQTKIVRFPVVTGSFELYAVANQDKSVRELIYTNNNSPRIPLRLLSPYSAEVTVDKSVVDRGGEVKISGKLTGQYTAGNEVETYIINDGVRQTVNAAIGTNGQFSATYVPYAAQMGHFTVGACFPGEELSDEMASFDIYGLRQAGNSVVTCEAVTGVQSTVNIIIENPGVLPLSSVTAKLDGVPEGCEASAEINSTIPPGGKSELSLTFTGSAASPGADWEHLSVILTSAEGATLTIPIYYYCRNPKGALETDINEINTNISLGTELEVPLKLTNVGGGATGRISLALPEWMKSATIAAIPSLAAGESTTAVLLITTNDKMNLNYTLKGWIGINCENGQGAVVNYSITPVTEEKGTVKVEACDEYTYYTAEAPKVSGAKVLVKHPSTGAVILETATGDNGTCLVELPGGYYQFEVSAEKHEPYSEFVFVSPGKTTPFIADISYNPITISWDVKETEIEDEYLIETTSKYETDVPMPVVKMTIPKSIDGDNMAVGDATIINMNLTNLGLIKAIDVNVILPKDEVEWSFEALDHNEPFDLNPHESVNVPIRITRIANTSRNVATNRSVAEDMFDSYRGCMVHMAETYKAICGKKLKNNSAAESMAMKTCATAATMGAVMQAVGNLFQDLSIPTPGSGGTSGGGGSGGGYSGPSGATNSFTICDPCDAEKGERIIDTLLGKSWMGAFWDILSKTVKRYREGGRSVKVVIHHIGSETRSAVENFALDNVPGGNILSLAADIVEITKPCENNDGNGSSNDDDADLFSRMPQRRDSRHGWQQAFNNEASQYVNTLQTMDAFMLAGFGDRIWYEDIDQGKLDFIEYAVSLPEGIIPSDEDIMTHKPESVSFEQAKAYILYLNADDSALPSEESFENLVGKFEESASYAESKGYTSMVDLFDQAYDDYKNNFEQMKSSSVCASVTLQITQQMTLTRQAFCGLLTVFNGHESTPMKDVKLNLLVRDSEGNVASSRQFQIDIESLDGFDGQLSLDGGWTLGAGETGTSTILFIPSRHAAPEHEEVYSFGGSISYLDPYTNFVVTRMLYPVNLTVKPSPALDLTYFMQRDVYADDPLTADVIEPATPAEFALVINNRGFGSAENVRMVTDQPRIIENEKGLLIDFSIIRSQLNGDDKVLSLGGSMATDFGTIPAHTTSYAQWWLQSSLLGHFTEYDVTDTHVTSHGNPDLSLLENVEIHELIHGLTADDAASPATRAFIVNDINDAEDMPDMVYFSNGSAEMPLSVASSVDMLKISDTVYEFQISPSEVGWIYGSTADLTGGQQKLVSVIRRSDGKSLPVDNFWQTPVTLRDGKTPVHEARIHMAGQLEEPETYTLTFEARPEQELKVVQFVGVTPNAVISSQLTSITVSFNKPVDAATFTANDLSLTCAGSPCDLSQVTIAPINDTDYRIDLSSATLDNGYYVLTVYTTGITDTEGFNGEEGKNVSWIQTVDGKVKLVVGKRPAEGGSVSPESSRVDINSKVTLSATPAEGYEFSGWERNGVLFTDKAVFEYEMLSDEEFTGVFSPRHFIVDIKADPIQGYVANAGSGIYDYGSELTLRAIANTGYIFEHWLVNDVIVDGSELTVTVSGDMSIVAVFNIDISSINNAYSYLPFCITPVPVHDIMTVAGNFNIIYELTVFSTSGKPLLHWNDLPQRVAVNVFDLPEGFYIVHAVTDNGIFTSKILKH